ncbi:hypothetical protein [Micromonospora sp. WMMD980]|uniref:hypothetical protein n=1 Tax=Micromonospora sp. WMMD980 TaxID=3016088 RepID=UPI00241634E6|nr:hypothetical protein [Micromonospora sp. WMMD980]MDG4803562.1 hypothetical protein [Micromonospora sp. WMMD980]
MASRTDPNRRTIEVRRLDLDHVTATDRWEILHLTGAERPEPLIAPLRESTGTVVMWEDLVRQPPFEMLLVGVGRRGAATA